MQQISTTIELKDTATNGFKVRYFTSCAGTLIQENNKCEGVKVGSTVDYSISIEVKHMFCNNEAYIKKDIFL